MSGNDARPGGRLFNIPQPTQALQKSVIVPNLEPGAGGRAIALALNAFDGASQVLL